MGNSSKTSRSKKKKKIATWLGIILGFSILGFLVAWTDFSEIIKAFQKAGPALLLLVLLYPIELLPYSYAWQILYPVDPSDKSPRYRLFTFGMWLSQSVNRMLPTANLGGDFVRARLLIVKDYNRASTITSLIANKTAQATSILGLIILGSLLIMTRTTRWEIIGSLIATSILLIISIFVFIRIQRSSGTSKLLERWTGNDDGLLSKAGVTAQKVEEQLDSLYEKPAQFIFSVAIRIAANAGLALEVWFAAWLIGSPVTLVEALTLRLVGFGIRSAAFIIWGGIGIQEGAYALLSTFVGLPPATLIAISLLTRVREILTGLPGLLTWLFAESLNAVRTTHENNGMVQAYEKKTS